MAITLSKQNDDAFKKVIARFKGNFIWILYELGPGGFDFFDRLI